MSQFLGGATLNIGKMEQRADFVVIRPIFISDQSGLRVVDHFNWDSSFIKSLGKHMAFS